MTRDGGSAFPLGTKTINKDHYTGDSYADEDGYEGGMTLRDYFAGQALAGVLVAWHPSEGEAEKWATNAYAVADAMLAAREAR
jgi:hypothetical protein